MSNQIEPQCLNKLIEKAVKVVDGSWALDGTNMYGRYVREHILGAVFFDIEIIRDHANSLPHMAPPPDLFAAAVGGMGISNDDHVVIYDQQGLFSAARVWWMFKVMGHEKVQVLRGGLPAWKLLHLPLTDAESTPAAARYESHFRPEMITDLNQLSKEFDKDAPPVVLDARASARFEGRTPEPRPGLRSGHMPGSRNLPYTELVKDGALKSRAELEAIFCAAGVADGQPVITTCGSGVTAAIINMALDEIGHNNVTLYDGSWAEWGQYTLNTPVVSA